MFTEADLAVDSPLRDDDDSDERVAADLPIRDEDSIPVCPFCRSSLLYVQEQVIRKEWIVEDVVIHYDGENLVEVDIPDEDVDGEVVDVVTFAVRCADDTCDYAIPAWQIHTVE